MDYGCPYRWVTEDHLIAFNEIELLLAAKSGDRQAFGELCRRHSRQVYRTVLRIVRNQDDAEDVLQDSLLSAFTHLDQFRGDSAFSTWLHRLSVNVVLMRLRKKRVKEISYESGDDGQESERPPRDFGAPDLSLNGVVDQVVEHLPQKARVAVHVRVDHVGRFLHGDRRRRARKSQRTLQQIVEHDAHLRGCELAMQPHEPDYKKARHRHQDARHGIRATAHAPMRKESTTSRIWKTATTW